MWISVGVWLVAASCASAGGPEPAEPASSAVEAEVVERDSPVEARRAIDEAGAEADCAPYAEASGDEAWLAAWCGLRAEQWELALRAAGSARRSFEASGQLRRGLEMSLIEALSAHRLEQASANEIAERAFSLWRDARIPLHAGLYARSGDLPYLFSRVVAARLLDDPVAPGGHPFSERALLDIAHAEYGSAGSREALPYVERATAELYIDKGRLDGALEHLRVALQLDHRASRTAGLRADLALFSRLCDVLGVNDMRPALDELVASGGSAAGAPGGPELDGEADWSAAEIDALLSTPHGRRLLAERIAALRGSAAQAIRPPKTLVGALRAHADFDEWTGESWRLGYQGGQLLAERGHRHDARRYLSAAVEAIEAMRSSLPTPALRQSFFADKRPVYMALVDLYVGVDTARRAQSDYRQALRLANALKARGLIDLLDGRIEPALATRPAPDALNLDESLSRSAAQVLSKLEQWTTPAKGAADQHRSAHIRLPESITGGLDDKTAVLEYLITPRRSYVWVLSKDAIHMRRLAGREEIEPLVEQFVATLDGLDDADVAARHAELAKRLYVELIGPVDDITSELDRLYIAPDRRLYELPFEALMRPRPDEPARYLIAERTVSYIPSAAVLARLARRDRPPASDRGLVVGAPDLDRSALELAALAKGMPDSGLFSLEQIFPKLPGARAELEAVGSRLRRAAFDVEVLAGAEASEARLRTDDLTGYGLIHLATHGVSDAAPIDSGRGAEIHFSQPALLFSHDEDQPDDGLVTLAELVGRATAAELVVLSGCTTGRGWMTLGEGAFGLAGAILYTGSRNVIASGWEVDDEHTAQLMAAMYDALAAGESPAAALRSGQLAMVERGQNPKSWAGFRMVGVD
jgi:CHAT domain-containing protein